MDRDDVEVNDIQQSLTKTMVIQGLTIVQEKNFILRDNVGNPELSRGPILPARATNRNRGSLYFTRMRIQPYEKR